MDFSKRALISVGIVFSGVLGIGEFMIQDGSATRFNPAWNLIGPIFNFFAVMLKLGVLGCFIAVVIWLVGIYQENARLRQVREEEARLESVRAREQVRQVERERIRQLELEKKALEEAKSRVQSSRASCSRDGPSVGAQVGGEIPSSASPDTTDVSPEENSAAVPMSGDEVMKKTLSEMFRGGFDESN